MAKSKLFRNKDADAPAGGKAPAEITREVERAFNWTINERRLALVTTSFVEGEQWVYSDRDGVRLQEAPAPRGYEVERVTRNRLGPRLRTVAAKLSNSLNFEVIAHSADDVARESADLATIVSNDTAHEHRYDELNRTFVWSMLTGGTGALILQWNPNGGGLGVDPETGDTFGQGDIAVSVADIGQFAVQPGSRPAEKAHYMVWVRNMPPSEAKELYELDEAPKPNSGTSSPGLSVGARATNNDDLVTVTTYIERPHDKSPGGVWTLIGGEIVEHTAWPYPFKDELPIEVGRAGVQLRKWQGYAPAWDALEPQVEANEALTRVRDNIDKFGDAKMLMPPTLDIEELESRPDVIVVPDAEPRWMVPLQLSPEVAAFGMSALESIDDVLGISDVVKGNAPRGVSSGTALAALIDQADETFHPLAGEVARAWGRLQSKVLALYEEKVRDPETREATVRENSMFTSKVAWNGDLLNGHTNAQVPLNSVMPRNRAAAMAIADSLWEKGLIKDARGFAAAAETPDADWLAVVDPDWKCAVEENHLMWAGRICPPEDVDDHEVHMLAITTFMKSRRFRDLPCQLTFDIERMPSCATHPEPMMGEPCKAVFYMHLKAHQTMAMQHSGELVAKQNTHPVAAATPDGLPVPDAVRATLGQAPDMQPEDLASGEQLAAQPTPGAMQ